MGTNVTPRRVETVLISLFWLMAGLASVRMAPLTNFGVSEEKERAQVLFMDVVGQISVISFPYYKICSKFSTRKFCSLFSYS